MKQTNINIDEIKRFPTVTNPIKADDLHTPQAYAYTLRRAIVTDCNDRQRAELVALLEGKESAEGVTFNNTKANRDRLHIWQNSESRKERAAILGEGWQYIEGLNHGTQPGDVITCIDGTRGRVTKSDAESCVIEFETEDGQRLSVAGYFRYTPSEKSETAITEAEGVKVGDKVRHNKHEEVATVTAIREAFVNRADGYRYLYTLDFGQSVLGPFQVELNGGEFLREAFTLCNPSEIKAADIARERQEKPGTVNTSWATDFTPEDFEKLTSRYEIADEDRDIVGRRFHTGEGLWTVDVFVSDYAGNEAHALIYLLTGEGEVRANVLSLDHLRQTLTEAKGWTRTA